MHLKGHVKNITIKKTEFSHKLKFSNPYILQPETT